MKIMICGDLVCTEGNESLFAEGRAEEITGEKIYHLLHACDAVICNIEAPITAHGVPIPKAGPNLKMKPGTEHGIAEMGITLACLANNHILDYGAQGLHDTVKNLSYAGIECFGTGNSLREMNAAKMIRDEKSGRRIGIYACAENEFSIAGKQAAGANPYDPLVSFDQVKNLRGRADYVVVLFHGGKEYYRYPSPYLQRVCRKFIDSGADLAVCQHSHCIGCEEQYRAGRIVYGQGNFIFDHGDDAYWKESILISIEVDESGFRNTYIPIVKTQHTVRMADEAEGEKIIREFDNRSVQIKDEAFVERSYETFCQSLGSGYLSIIRGNKLGNAVLNKFIYHKKWEDWYSDRELLSIRNIIECEAHREAFLHYLKMRV